MLQYQARTVDDFVDELQTRGPVNTHVARALLDGDLKAPTAPPSPTSL